MNTTPILTIGTTSKKKITAMLAAIARGGWEIEHRAVKTASGVPEQPFGLDETRTGATNRARAALLADVDATYGLGVENGIVPIGGGLYIDMAVVVLLDRGCNVLAVTTSCGIPCPAGDLAKSLADKQDTTAGKYIGQRTGCDDTDWHSHFTGGKFGRDAILADAIYGALALWFAPACPWRSA